MRESDMLLPLRQWLKRTRRIRPGSLIAEELSWQGRRVDLATLTLSGSSTAYELKIANNLRAIEQAAKNAHAFGRSYIVTATIPSPSTRRIAEQVGIGILAFSEDRIRTIVSAPLNTPPRSVSHRLRRAITNKGRCLDV